MPVLVIDQLTLAFGDRPLLDEAHLSVEKGQRLGLIGRNGSGKSSLLRILAGEITADEGTVWLDPTVKRAYVPQEPILNPQHTVFEAVSEGLGPLKQQLQDYDLLVQQIAQAPSESLLIKLEILQENLEQKGGWRLNTLVDTILTQLKLPAKQQIQALSGGWKKRVALARALVSEPSLLLLDEPTNHLDIAAIEALEELLQRYPGTLIFITHDRHFLDRLANSIIELDRGRLTSFTGNFASYRLQKETALETERVHRAKFDKFWRAEEAWIRQGVEARRTRNEGRVRRLNQLRDERNARLEQMGHVKMQLSHGVPSGQLVAELKAVDFSYGNTQLVDRFSAIFKSGDRVGLIGPNGAGKTTLLKLILGELTPQNGSIRLGTRLNIAYFDQFRQQLEEGATLAQTISPGSEFMEIGGKQKHVISYLEEFLFSPARSRSTVSALSGGERNRLLLARLFSKPANVLVLDEPTNDLDLETLELLEELLLAYSGTVFLVTHDRVFLDHVVTSSLVFEGAGKVQEYVGGYTDWFRHQAAKADKKTAALNPKIPKNSAIPTTLHALPKTIKLSFKEKSELDSLPEHIESLEKQLQHCQQWLINPENYKNNAERSKYASEVQEIEQFLAKMLDRWESLEKKSKQKD